MPSQLIVTYTGLAPAENQFKLTYSDTSSLVLYASVNPINPAQTLANSINVNYPTLVIADYIDNVVTITALNDTATFSNAGQIPTGDIEAVEYQYSNVENPNTVGSVDFLSGDRYFINNEIWLVLSSDSVIDYYKIRLRNLSNQKTSIDFIIYPDNFSDARVNIQPIVKSMFDYPTDAEGYVTDGQLVNNANKYEITILQRVSGQSEVTAYQETKTFIRGGKRTNDTNQTIAALSVLRPSLLLPIWNGYDTAEYYLDADNLIRKRLIASVSEASKDYRRSKGCNEVYFKFLNQQGGYSNWLFESHSANESNANLGGFIRDNKVDDLGNESSNKLQVFGKIPREYINLIDDLIISPEIYAFIDGAYIRVRSARNQNAQDELKRSYSVNLNFDFDYRFNPSLLWSN